MNIVMLERRNFLLKEKRSADNNIGSAVISWLFIMKYHKAVSFLKNKSGYNLIPKGVVAY